MESGKFDKNGEFGESDYLTTFRHKDLDLRRPAKDMGIRNAANSTKMANLAKLTILRHFVTKT